jgi:uncharacterized protein YbjT (DUF2867 family)
MADGQNMERLILVCGATGKQGGAVARSLLKRGFRVRALTRDPQKPEAQALAEQGAEVVQGDMEDCSAMDQVLVEGIYGVFSVQNFWETGYDREVQQGKTVADAAKAAGVEHFVYTSVGSAHRQTGIPHFESKWEIEEHIRQIELPYTILRPVFMQNWEWMREMILGGTLAQPLDPDKPLQQVAVEDVGAFTAIAFENPDLWIGREVDLAGDEQSMTEIAETFGRVIGREVSYYQVPWDQFEEQMGEEATANFRWINDVGYEADIAALRQEYPKLTSFERYLRSHGWEGAEVPAGG